MYEFELHQARSAELRRRAANERLALEAARVARAARREAAARAAERSDGDAGSESDTRRPRRFGFPRPT
ncbi:hypothetical protein GCM10010269_61310 [Streptomyces humidus]|uniref:Uncharacterized protein n=1 Tax=Streptomyces humidus TaxID=52259 RepID=A0A918L6Y0_9ACTN|nr:hypothetical protein [Streptomyces humidus]GGS13775.1 hypothetical protein GCM10010269_61310 [Streptomyces humidus]